MSLKGVTCIKEGLICEYITLQEWDHHRRHATSSPSRQGCLDIKQEIVRHLPLAKVTGASVLSEVQVLPEAAVSGLLQGLHQKASNHALAERESQTCMSNPHYSLAFQPALE